MALRSLIVLMLCLFLAACTTKHYRKSADKEVAKAIAQKTPLVPNMDTNFTIEASGEISLEGLPVSDKAQEFFGPDSEMERGAKVISLEKALELAVNHSRTYQNRKELLYLQALNLTLERHRFTPIFSGRVRTRYNRSSTEIKNGVNRIVEERQVTVSGDTGLDILMRTGTRIAVDFSQDFLRFVTGDSRVATSSALAGTLTQPLLRGAGYKIASENLTQAERNLLYALRDFTRFRKEFSVDIAASYYNVLQNRDAVRNSWRGFQNFKQSVAREHAFADEGLRSRAFLDQVKQAELNTESRWINALRVYRQSLDQFKVQLGLPANAHVVLDETELDKLEINHPSLTAEEAIKVAQISRLDLHNQQDQFEDAQRKIKVAANGLLPQLDLVASASTERRPGEAFPTPDFSRYRWSAGLDLDLPLDRKSQRNSYRASLIAFERAGRELTLATDNIWLQINDDMRKLEQSRRNYEISLIGVQIAERRLEEQRLRQELGRGTARDLVDAQNDLIDSRNQRTSALISHTIERLRFWRDMGILMIKEDGQWEETSEPNEK